MLLKTKMEKKPVYIYEHIGNQTGRNTRQEADRVGDLFSETSGTLKLEEQRKHLFLVQHKTGITCQQV